MPTTAFSSQGSQLKVTISTVPTLIPGVVGLPIPGTDPEFDDITNLDSAGGYRERIQVGNAFVSSTYEVIWNPASAVHAFLAAAAAAGTVCNFTAVLSNAGATTYTWSAYVKFEPKADARKAGRFTLTLSATGAITGPV